VQHGPIVDVAAYTPGEIEQLRQLHGVLYALTARVAASTCTRQELAVLTDLLADIEAAARRSDDGMVTAASMAFERALAAIAGSELIARRLAWLRDTPGALGADQTSCARQRASLVLAHRRLIEALAVGDGEGAELAVRPATVSTLDRPEA
jgi:DNA-binding GntR family transcriptional regulator